MSGARILIGRDTDPRRNLAREESLLLRYGADGPDETILYLWQNAPVVVIGRNQNAWQECRVTAMERDGVLLARRTTGGGAVYHDAGNLNFSFLGPRDRYDLDRQLGVIRSAVAAFGIDCEFSGRNDLLADGRKFSGNAFRFTRFGSLHHGTLLVSADFSALGRYLRPSEAKLKAKGIRSVSSRVVNLSELAPVTIASLTDALCRAYGAQYGAGAPEDADALTWPGFDALVSRNASWEWNCGAAPAFDAQLEHRFAWGELQLQLTLRDGITAEAAVYSDAMDPELAPALAAALRGCRFTAEDLAARAAAVSEEAAAWLRSLSL